MPLVLLIGFRAPAMPAVLLVSRTLSFSFLHWLKKKKKTPHSESVICPEISFFVFLLA